MTQTHAPPPKKPDPAKALRLAKQAIERARHTSLVELRRRLAQSNMLEYDPNPPEGGPP